MLLSRPKATLTFSHLLAAHCMLYVHFSYTAFGAETPKVLNCVHMDFFFFAVGVSFSTSWTPSQTSDLSNRNLDRSGQI